MINLRISNNETETQIFLQLSRVSKFASIYMGGGERRTDGSGYLISTWKLFKIQKCRGSSMIVPRLNLNAKYTINLKASLNNYRADLPAALT